MVIIIYLLLDLSFYILDIVFGLNLNGKTAPWDLWGFG